MLHFGNLLSMVDWARNRQRCECDGILTVCDPCALCQSGTCECERYDQLHDHQPHDDNNIVSGLLHTCKIVIRALRIPQL